jgi:hypothetical protein
MKQNSHVVETRLNKPRSFWGEGVERREGDLITLRPFVFFVPDGRKKTTTTFGAVNNNSVCDAFHSKTQETKSTKRRLKLRATGDQGPMKSRVKGPFCFVFLIDTQEKFVIMCNLNIKVWIAKRIKRTQDGRLKNRTTSLLHNFYKIHSNRCVIKNLQVTERSSMF